MGKGDKEEEYEVQSILEARLEKKRGRKPVVLWKYRVRWKGYTEDDDTWEPEASFQGSEDIIEHFWQRANTSGRDYRKPGLFNIGDNFLPMGPPRRKMKRKSINDANSRPNTPEKASPVASSSLQPTLEKKQTSASKRPHSPSSPEIPEPPAKRVRGRNPDLETNAESSRHHDAQLERAHVPTPLKSTTQKSTLSTSPRDIASSSKRRKQKKRRTPSPEIIPGSSDEEDLQMIQPEIFTPLKDTAASHLLQDTQHIDMPPLPDDSHTNEEPDSLFDEDLPQKQPAHRERMTKPLVKMLDDADATVLEGAISTKARITARGKTDPSSSRSSLPTSSTSRRVKPGPGRSSEGTRSSLLTFQKGGLKTLKGKYVRPERQTQAEVIEHSDEIEEVLMETDDVAGPTSNGTPPSGEELLKLAGLDSATIDELPEFEDDVQQQQHAQRGADSSPKPQQQEEAASTLRKSINSAKDKLFPSALADAISESNKPWKMPRPTIFGPLASGSQSIIKTIKNIGSTESSESTSFFLTLDSSISVPVLLTDATTPSGPSLHSIIGASGPPGKFYGPEAALPLISALRTGGASARVTIDNKASEENKKHFDRFSNRLEKGDLFLALAGAELLAFCSSSNIIIAQGLNFPPALISAVPGGVLVCRVSVENYSEYADLAGRADDTRWLQYIGNSS